MVKDSSFSVEPEMRRVAANEKEVRYRASILVRKRGIPYKEALTIAEMEVREHEKALKAARKDVYAQKGRATQKRLNEKKKRNKAPTYTANGTIVGSMNKFSYYPTVGASGFVDYAASPEADSSSSGMSRGSFFLPVASRSACAGVRPLSR